MTYDKACKIAYDYLQENGFIGLYLAVDIGDAWMFGGGKPDEVFYGVRTVTVDKQNGNINWFAAHTVENYKLIENANELDIPEAYRYKE